MWASITFLRAVIFSVWLGIASIPFALLILLTSLFVRGKPLYYICCGYLYSAIWGGRLLCGIRYRVHGKEALIELYKQGKKVVLCAKHQSTWETFALPVVLPIPLSYVFKKELVKIPFFGWAMAKLDMVRIDRSKGLSALQEVVKQSAQTMNQGYWMVIFPEGTRVNRGEQGAYQTGAALVAVKTQTPIVPVAITSSRVWPAKGWFRQKSGIVDVSFGPTIDPASHTSRSLIAAVQEWIELEMRRLDPEAYASSQANQVREHSHALDPDH